MMRFEMLHFCLDHHQPLELFSQYIKKTMANNLKQIKTLQIQREFLNCCNFNNSGKKMENLNYHGK